MVRVADQSQTVLAIDGAEDVVDVITRYGTWTDEDAVTLANGGPRGEPLIGGGRIRVATPPASRTQGPYLDAG